VPNRSPKRPGSTARGLGHAHQLHRERLLLRHIDGMPCFWCGNKMFKDAIRNPDRRPLHADHSKSRSQYGTGNSTADRLLHASCNEARGDGSRDHLRPALGDVSTSPDADPDFDPQLGRRPYFDWPD
jgi:hypothetical protein